MRKKLYEIIEPSGDGGILSSFYDYLIMVTIVVSMIPLAFKETNTVFQWMEYVTVGIFILDYLLRLLTADFKLKKGALSIHEGNGGRFCRAEGLISLSCPTIKVAGNSASLKLKTAAKVAVHIVAAISRKMIGLRRSNVKKPVFSGNSPVTSNGFAETCPIFLKGR